MALILRINKIAEKLKLFEDELEKKKEVLKSKEEMFCHLNEFMEEFYPKHKWTGLPLGKRRKIYFEEPKGSFDYKNRLLPKFIPFNKIESDLYLDIINIYTDVIKKEILRRRELKRGKIKNN